MDTRLSRHLCLFLESTLVQLLADIDTQLTPYKEGAFIQEGCWLDPQRSIVKAADALRRECNRIMVAFDESNLEQTVQSILGTLRAGYRLERRAAFPSSAQLLLDGLDWQLELLIT